MVRESWQTRKMTGVIVPEDHSLVSGLIMVDVHKAICAKLRADELPEVKLRTVGEENITSHISGKRTAFIEGDVVRFHNR